jgi:hypothetical protein
MLAAALLLLLLGACCISHSSRTYGGITVPFNSANFLLVLSQGCTVAGLGVFRN